ncbi:tRNA1(Val) (adenine(37)-N6)-methyltransferase [Shimia sp. SK013]|uniref:tRNA1(Val) (adenine(37)-N6)-methyltransferase n=1 Tax=Shimia sp. SK013 TaxID=1389006 RepID=UPI0006B45022|nr:methyltransferase [Shimia sp. SK013]KPA21570.1 tRNA1(Val) (adenine(37)-N6)-methyltransferase [Shimia sp. SK013]
MTKTVTENAFLGGQLSIIQPEKGYRAGVDPVLLAASLPAKSGQSVLELGCGVGTASFCLAARVPGLKLSAIEIQPDYAELARKNATRNGIEIDVFEGDLQVLPEPLRQIQFDHVIANPPYFDRAASTAAVDSGREVAMGEATPLAHWVMTAARRLRQGGYASFIHRTERLPDLLSAMSGRLGSIQVLPLQAREGREPGLVLVRGRKGGRADFRLHAPVLMHLGARHEADGDSYTPQIRAVLRDGAPLPFETSAKTA